MLFKGTDRRDSLAINNEIENLGGNVNAFTTYDHTVYHLVLSSRFWREGLDVLADMTFHSRLDEEEFEIERQVILEEIREGDDSLENYLGERFFGALYPGHPYGRPVIADAETIRRFDTETLRAFYSRWYRPKNMVLSVAGNVEWHLLVDAVRELTGDLTNGSSPVPILPKVSESKEAVFTLLGRGTEERILEVAFPTPNVRHEDVPALELLSIVLAGGEMSRLFRELRLKRELTRLIQTNLFVPLERGLFIFHTLPYAGLEKELIQELIRQLRILKNEPVSPLELSRAKLTLDKEIIFSDETAEGRSKILGYFQLTYGAFEEEERYRERVMAVTEPQIRQVAQRYFDIQKMGLSLLLPKQEKLLTSVQIWEWISAVEQPRNERKSSGRPGRDVEHWELGQGTRAVFRRLPSAKIAAVYAAVTGGLWTETREKNGISSLIAATLDRGTKNRSDDQIAEEVTLFQADLEGVAGRNFQGLRMEAVQKNFDVALDLFTDVLFNPYFGRAELRQERNVILRELETQKDYFETAAGNLFLETLYPSHPYGLNLLGNPASVSKLGTAQLREHYRTYVRPDRLVLSVVADVSPDLLKERLESLIPKNSKTGSPLSLPSQLPPLEGIREVRRPIQGEKAYVQYGFRGTTLSSPDRFALDVLSTLLASSGGGRLYVRLREELGLVYSVDTTVVHGLAEGYLAVSLNTAPEQVEQALEEVRTELGEVRGKLVSTEELERVKNFIVGNYEIDLQRGGPQAAQLCLGELYGTERTLKDYILGIQAVTPKDVQAAGERYLTPDRAVVVLLSPMVN